MEDPQNLGALLRVADGAGVDGIILTERRSAPISPVAVKASAGAAEHLRIARVVNLVRALEELKKQNLWVIGLDERGASDYDQFDFTGDCVLVLGREGAGLHDLVRRTCDHLLRIPMAGGVSSLNVSTAGAVVLYEAARQRRTPPFAPKALLASTRPARPRRNRKALVHEVFLARTLASVSVAASLAVFPGAAQTTPSAAPGPGPCDPTEAAVRTSLTQPSGKVIFQRSIDANGERMETPMASPPAPPPRAR